MTIKEEFRMSPVETKSPKQNTLTRVQNELIKVDLHSVQLPCLSIYENKDEKNNNGFKELLENDRKNMVIEPISVVDSNEEYSPCLSPSSSFENQSPKDRVTNKGPSYERKLLKKRHDIANQQIDGRSNDKTLGYYSDDPTERNRVTNGVIVDKGGSWDRKLSKKVDCDSGVKLIDKTLRRNSSSSKKKDILRDIAYDSSSPRLSRKFDRKNILNFERYPDSAASSSNENEKNERKLRRTSLGKRKKSSLSELKKRNSNIEEQQQPARRTSRFRRRKSSDYSSNITNKQKTSVVGRTRGESIGTDNLNFKIENETEKSGNHSKLILLYSGNVSDAEKKIHIETIDNADTPDEVLTDYDDSSATSDIEYKSGKSRRPQRGLAKKVWRSINSLFQLDDKTKKVYDKTIPDTPPSLRRSLLRDRGISNSMPGGLERSQNNLKQGDRTSKDDFCLLALEKELRTDEGLTFKRTMSLKKTKKMKQRSKARENDVTKARSRSLDFLSDSISKPRIDTEEWYKRKKSLPVSFIHKKSDTENDTKYDIVICQTPSNIVATQATTDDDNKESDAPYTNEITPDVAKNEHGNISSTKPRLDELKSTLQEELESFLLDKYFEPDMVNKWCQELSESMKERVVSTTKSSYKVAAQVFIGALYDDGIHAAVQSICDPTKDDFITVTYRGKDLFAIAAILTFEFE